MLFLDACCPSCGETGPTVDEEFGEATCEACGTEYRWEVIVACDVLKTGKADA